MGGGSDVMTGDRERGGMGCEQKIVANLHLNCQDNGV